MMRGRRWKETVVLNLEPTPGFEPGTFSLPSNRFAAEADCPVWDSTY